MQSWVCFIIWGRHFPPSCIQHSDYQNWTAENYSSPKMAGDTLSPAWRHLQWWLILWVQVWSRQWLFLNANKCWKREALPVLVTQLSYCELQSCVRALFLIYKAKPKFNSYHLPHTLLCYWRNVTLRTGYRIWRLSNLNWTPTPQPGAMDDDGRSRV